MSIRQAAILLPMCSLILLGSCVPSLNVTRILELDNEPLPTKDDATPYTQEEVQKAILRACTQRGWIGQVQGEGLILASIKVRTHSAKIAIQYTNSAVSISHVESYRLDYRDGWIHPNYNRWVTILYRSILSELGVASPAT